MQQPIADGSRGCRIRVALCLAIVACLLPTTGAVAARTVCQLVKDRADDANDVEPFTRGQSDPSLDIRSVDVATSPRLLTVVVRVTNLAFRNPAELRLPRYSASFVHRERTFEVNAYRGPDGEFFDISTSQNSDTSGVLISSQTATGVFDESKSEVRVTAPLAAIEVDGKIDPAERLTELGAMSWRDVGSYGSTPYAGTTLDTTSRSGTYRFHVRSCVTPGR